MPSERRFSYYRRLSAADQRTYRKSDQVTAVNLPRAPVVRPLADAVRAALESGRRSDVERCAQALCRALTASLRVPPVLVKVRSVRPADRGGELHGLYTWESGKQPVVEVWMRTARNRDVVAFRTFLRTLLHEVCHHLDFTLLELPETFHTDGFFRRESSLVRQLLGPRPRDRRPNERDDERKRPSSKSGAPKRSRSGVRSGPSQLKLFD